MGLPQREGRPALNISPEATPDTASWAEDYDNVGMNPLNKPVELRKGKEPVNGWLTVAADIFTEGDDLNGMTKDYERR